MTATPSVSAGLWALAVVGLLAACQPKEEILQGERLDLRAPLDGTAAPAVATNATAAIRLPAQVTNSEWTHRNGTAQHRITHPALGTSLAPLWTASIGQAEGRRHRITADPVVAGGRVFALDSRSTVSGFATNGTALWTRDLTPAGDNADDASGGGLAYGGGRVFVTTGFGKLAALDPATGAVIWIQQFDAPVTGAPTVEGDLVYVVAQNSTAWAVETGTGRVRWQSTGTPTIAGGLVGGPGPALTDRLVILPFPSGEVKAALKSSGLDIWTDYVAGQRLGRAYAALPDITGDPVIVGDVIYVGNQSGRVAAIDANSGARIWTANEGAYSPVWPVDNALFLISDQGKLVRLDAGSGATVWSVALPYFKADKAKKYRDVFAHYGPVLAGGRLIVASDDQMIRQFDPASGALLGTVALPGGAATNPVVAGGVLYVVTTDGKLHAFR